MPKTLKFCLLFCSLLIISPPAWTQTSRPAPETSSGFRDIPLARTKTAMVVAANPLAAKAGLEILNLGGNAMDAAIAVQLVLNLVEPQSSGIGGGGFLLYWEACKQNLIALDGRETAPMDASPQRFLKKDGSPMNFRDARPGRRSIGIPGLVKLMSQAHKKYGRLDWEKLFRPAISLAKAGFPVSPRLYKLLKWRNSKTFGSTAKAYFFDAKQNPRPVGYILKNPAFAATLKELAQQGEKAFYQPGHPLSQKIIRKVWRANENNVSYKDLASYRVIERTPLCSLYRGYKICSMGPPSSGVIVVTQVLKMLEPHKTSKFSRLDIMRMILAEKLAYADRKRYIADPDFSQIPKGLLDKDYLDQRAKLIPPKKILDKMSSQLSKEENSQYGSILKGTVKPGLPPKNKGNFGKDASIENDGTTHISIMDAEGNVLSMTTTIEAGFGSGLMTGGFLLNNELTDFSFVPTDRQGRPVANRLQPGKRPRSSMTPTIIFDPKGKPFMALGSPGGSRIPLYVLKTIVAVIDWDMDAQQAVSSPNFGSRNKKNNSRNRKDRRNRGMEIEKGSLAQGIANQIEKSPISFFRPTMNSGLHIIIKRKDHLEGGVDPRREGLAIGF